ncbi:MAG: hypothetical protein K0S53_3348 [Bacteroidetes bacterium]|jgi:hypothetical protein|nr:hypothetical protein [Bacteroidota bacterium]MDF2451427.1 hypothetical protein [Bacteroidota bacterium]
MLNTALLIGIGVVCLIMTVLALIFGVISLANNKPAKFLWLTVFLTSLVGLIVCIFIVVRKAVHAVEDFAENTAEQFDTYADSLAGHLKTSSIERHEINPSSPQIKILKSYLPANILNNEPEAFYTYAGFKDYYRYPLRYPFSIHCMYSTTGGELYNEVNVTRFDENDNGEMYSGISNISKIAFDKNFLLIEQEVSSTRTDKIINHYILFNFETEKKEEAPSLSKLLQLAKEKGYGGPDSLITLEQYHSLF